ncbi:hypothetical protein IJG72_07955 [bacterium]|nr:hypothetical protein [bacterium]
MSEYLILAETVIYKNDKLTCMNVYNNFRTVAMPAEFNFDMAILCGPKWSVGEHNLRVKAVASNGKEIDLGTAKVNIPHEDFVYNAFLQNIKIVMDYSVSDLTFYVNDNDKEVYSRKYPVLPMLVPQKQDEGIQPEELEKELEKDAQEQPQEEHHEEPVNA